MPDEGVPALATSPVTKAHTATQQWQSFEFRMRQRRAERCRLRAEAAIGAGSLDEAREALDEARRVHPDLPGLLLAEEHLAGALLGKHDDAPATSHPGRRASAAAAIALVVGVGSWALVGEWDGTFSWRPQTSVTATSADSMQPSRATLPPTDRPAAPAPEGTSHSAPVPIEDVPELAPVEPGAPHGDPGERAETTFPLTPDLVVPPPPTPEASPPPVPQIPAPRPETALPIPPPTTSLPIDAPAAATAAGTPTAVAPPAPAPPVDFGATEASPEVAVRAALSRYEAAYSTLNTAAARAIWPTVDAGALARAFDSLEWQQINLGSCSIAVAHDSRSARATCAGTATWTPRVGGGRTTRPRSWQFELEPQGGEWQIVSARTR